MNADGTVHQASPDTHGYYLKKKTKKNGLLSQPHTAEGTRAISVSFRERRWRPQLTLSNNLIHTLLHFHFRQAEAIRPR